MNVNDYAPSSSATPIPSCSIIIVGTKADKKDAKIIASNTYVYQELFPSLHFVDEIHHISTLYNHTSARNLIVDIESQCSQIMKEHTNLIPLSYKQLLADISSIKSSSPILPLSTVQSLPNTRWKSNPDLMKRGLSHLHSIGEIVLFGKDKICQRPEEVSHLMAKFISPSDIRNSLLRDEEEQVSILPTSSISKILRVKINR